MSRPAFASPRDEIVDTMINLTHLSRAHRIVVAGGDGIELYLALRRRGFGFGVLASTCRTPSARHSVGLIAGDRCYQSIEATISQIGRLLCPAASLTISIESQESGLAAKREQALVHAVEEPPARRDEDDENVVPAHALEERSAFLDHDGGEIHVVTFVCHSQGPQKK